jgi:hypothetical protein
MRHVGSPLFAVIVCRKFATAAAFSWYLPHQKKCRSDYRRKSNASIDGRLINDHQV